MSDLTFRLPQPVPEQPISDEEFWDRVFLSRINVFGGPDAAEYAKKAADDAVKARREMRSPTAFQDVMDFLRPTVPPFEEREALVNKYNLKWSLVMLDADGFKTVMEICDHGTPEQLAAIQDKPKAE